MCCGDLRSARWSYVLWRFDVSRVVWKFYELMLGAVEIFGQPGGAGCIGDLRVMSMG